MNAATTVGIIGSGAMGTGIAQVAAEAGHPVLIFDSNPSALDRASESLQKLYASLVAKGKRSQQQADAILGRIKFVKSLLDLSAAGLVIEAIIEDLGVKQHVFEQLSDAVSPTCILATNTSSLSVTAIAAAAKHPENVLGIHFFNPAPLMKLVEVVAAAQTRQGLADEIKALMQAWGKVAVLAQDIPGFIVNRVARPYYSEALRMLDERLASAPEIDAAMEALGFRMGPFYLMDFIGHDVNFRVTESMFHAYWGEPRYKPSFSQKQLLDAGYLGRKAGRGFYRFDENKQPMRAVSSLSAKQQAVIQDRILAVLINEAADAMYFGIASAEDIDNAMLLGVNYPKGLLAWAKELGPEQLISRLETLWAHYQEERYRVSPGLRVLAKA